MDEEQLEEMYPESYDVRSDGDLIHSVIEVY